MAASTFLTRIESYRDPTVLWPLAAVASVVAHGLVLLGLRPWLITLQPQPESLPEPIPIQLLGDPSELVAPGTATPDLPTPAPDAPVSPDALPSVTPPPTLKPPSPPDPTPPTVTAPPADLVAPKPIAPDAPKPLPPAEVTPPPVRHRPLSYPHLLPA